MQDVGLILSVIFIHTLAWMTPGPLFVLILSQSLIYSRKTGFYTALGIGFGNMIHTTYVFCVMFFLTSFSEKWFFVLKILGGCYLLYLGYKILSSPGDHTKSAQGQEKKKQDISSLEAIKHGFLTNILSPKAPLFFLSIFSAVIGTQTSLFPGVFLWIYLPIHSILMASVLVLFFTQARVRKVYEKYKIGIDKILGIVVIGFALRLLMQS